MNSPVHNASFYDRVIILEQGNFLLSCMTTLRNYETSPIDFHRTFEVVSTQLIAAVHTDPFNVETPTGLTYSGCKQVKPICGVSILRAGESFENALRRCCGMGKILIQRDEETFTPTHLYSKLPRNIKESTVLILEPMLATGGSASKAVESLKEKGVSEGNIIFVNLVASRFGLETIMTRFPELRLVTAAIDEQLTSSRHIAPGLGDFGDRFYGTEE
ncbi:hypothetical protein NQ176_g368 [Zarea fungicola]|uniref:Uncharacterized protein n=1 Tax=Zarea fungicola TaxID=93591 RepID=A0ACC1NWZ6_9HYPO|nr:hypothetical protein NQ176_g368 [Lecanicillium fungicola]